VQIKTGGTRLVLVFSKFVFKIPIIHVRYPFTYLFAKDKSSIPERLQLNSFRKIFKYVFAGFIANHLEYQYFKKNKNSEGIMKIKAVLWGVFITQRTGQVPDENDKRWLRLSRAIKRIGIKEHDTLRACNFCIWENRIRISDYGHEDTISALEKTNLKIIERFGLC
jgi:hypothetical protein